MAMVARPSGMHLLIKQILISDTKWVQGAGLAPSTSVPAPWYYRTTLHRPWLRMSRVDGNWSEVHTERVCVCRGLAIIVLAKLYLQFT